MRTRAGAEPGSRPGAGFEAQLASYLEACRARGDSRHNLFHLGWGLRRFGAFLQERGVEVRGVSEALVVEWLRGQQRAVSLRGRPYSPWTIRTRLAQVRCFFAYLERQGLVLVDPSREVKLPPARHLPRRVLSERHAHRLMSWPNPGTPLGLRDRAILELLYGTAIRAGECVRLELSDLDLAGGALLVRNGKGRKDRVVPIPVRAARALQAYLAGGRPELVRSVREQALLLSRRPKGGRLTVGGLQVVVVKRARAAGLPWRCAPHALRHTCATHLLRGGADLRHVQELLGHSDIGSTQLYTRVDTTDLARMLERAHPRERERRRQERLAAKQQKR